MNKETIITLISFLLITILVNYALHTTIINQDKELRQSVIQYVEENCKSQNTQINKNNITFTKWNTTTTINN